MVLFLQVDWYHPTLDLGNAPSRAAALLVVVQLTRWWALMSRLLPIITDRLTLWSPIERDNGVTVLLIGKRYATVT